MNSMQYLLSKPIVASLLERVKEEADTLIGRGIDPHLAVVQVGDDPNSTKYIGMKSKLAKHAGIIVSHYHIEEGSPDEEVEQTLAFLAKDPEISGTILQLPLPEYIAGKTDALIQQIAPHQDVDGLRGEWTKVAHTQTSIESLLQPMGPALPPMICAVLSLFDYYTIELAGQKVVLVGNGRLVGAPLFSYLQQLGVDVSVVDENTEHILTIVQQADIVISGTGHNDLITYQWIKEGAVVVDCAADVHQDSVSQVAKALAPSTGGVGPLTTAWLLYNTIQAAKLREV